MMATAIWRARGWLLAVVSEAAAVAVAVLRVLAGLHHVEDVIASFLIAHAAVVSGGQEPFCQMEVPPTVI